MQSFLWGIFFEGECFLKGTIPGMGEEEGVFPYFGGLWGEERRGIFATDIKTMHVESKIEYNEKVKLVYRWNDDSMRNVFRFVRR